MSLGLKVGWLLQGRLGVEICAFHRRVVICN